jgi:hypothetical protein
MDFRPKHLADNPENGIIDLLSLMRTCSRLRDDTPIPTKSWHVVTLQQVFRFRNALTARYDDVPTGRTSAFHLLLTLNEEFAAPVEKALADARSASVGEEDERWTAQDVFRWWTYDPAWRSRRRVWTCAVHACATARDAEWL